MNDDRDLEDRRDRKERRKIYIVVPVDRAFVLAVLCFCSFVIVRLMFKMYLENMAYRAMLGLH